MEGCIAHVVIQANHLFPRVCFPCLSVTSAKHVLAHKCCCWHLGAMTAKNLAEAREALCRVTPVVFSSFIGWCYRCSLLGSRGSTSALQEVALKGQEESAEFGVSDLKLSRNSSLQMAFPFSVGSREMRGELVYVVVSVSERGQLADTVVCYKNRTGISQVFPFEMFFGLQQTGNNLRPNH